MTNHVHTAKRDGNGFPGGVRLSWPALSVILAASWGTISFVDTIRARDAKAIAELEETITERFDKVDERLEKVRVGLAEHRANPDAHVRIKI